MKDPLLHVQPKCWQTQLYLLDKIFTVNSQLILKAKQKKEKIWSVVYFHQYNLYNKIFRGKLMGILRLHRKEALNVMKCCVWLAGRSGLKCKIIRLDWTTASLLEIKNNLIQLNWQILMDTNTAGSKQMTHRARGRSKQQTEWESQYTGENQDRESYIWVLTYLPAISGEHSWKKINWRDFGSKIEHNVHGTRDCQNKLGSMRNTQWESD